MNATEKMFTLNKEEVTAAAQWHRPLATVEVEDAGSPYLAVRRANQPLSLDPDADMDWAENSGDQVKSEAVVDTTAQPV